MSLATVTVAPRLDSLDELSTDPWKLDAILYSHGRLRAAVERVLGKGLAKLSDNEGLLKLGYVKLGDYVNQCLGIGVRLAQQLRTIENRLPAFPVMDAAYQAGVLSKSKVRALLEAAILPQEELKWVELARSWSVRQLNAALKERRAKGAASAQAEGMRHVDPDVQAEGILSVDADLHPHTSGGMIDLEVSRELAMKFEVACEIERRQAGYDVPAGHCVEAFAAEFCSSIVAADLMGDVADEIEIAQAANLARRARRTRKRDRDMATAERRSHNWKALPQTVLFALPPAELLAPLPDDPFLIDQRLRQIVAYRQRYSRQFMEALWIFKRFHAFRPLGFRNMEQYSVERLGMSRRCVETLIWLHERLEDLPEIADEFYAGHIHQTQAEWLVKSAAAQSESQPIDERRLLDMARHHTVRHLREQVQFELDREVYSSVLDFHSPRQTCAPAETHRLRFWLPAEVEANWLHVQIICNAIYGRVATPQFCLEQMVDAYLEEHLPRHRQELKSHPIIARDGGRCAVPVCTVRKNLHEHHYRFRSHGGGDEPENIGCVCSAHHLRGIHMERIVVSGKAPDELIWRLGTRPDGPPHLVVGMGVIESDIE